jgi:hypothetical protein
MAGRFVAKYTIFSRCYFSFRGDEADELIDSSVQLRQSVFRSNEMAWLLVVKFQEIVHAARIWEDGVVETTNNPIPADEHSF